MDLILSAAQRISTDRASREPEGHCVGLSDSSVPHPTAAPFELTGMRKSLHDIIEKGPGSVEGFMDCDTPGFNEHAFENCDLSSGSGHGVKRRRSSVLSEVMRSNDGARSSADMSLGSIPELGISIPELGIDSPLLQAALEEQAAGALTAKQLVAKYWWSEHERTKPPTFMHLERKVIAGEGMALWQAMKGQVEQYLRAEDKALRLEQLTATAARLIEKHIDASNPVSYKHMKTVLQMKEGEAVWEEVKEGVRHWLDINGERHNSEIIGEWQKIEDERQQEAAAALTGLRNSSDHLINPVEQAAPAAAPAKKMPKLSGNEWNWKTDNGSGHFSAALKGGASKAQSVCHCCGAAGFYTKTCGKRHDCHFDPILTPF
jgi:hypothetical protein